VKRIIFILFLSVSNLLIGQNSIVGDGFGGRLWYTPTNYGVGSYSAYSTCYDDSSRLYCWGDNGYNQLGLGFILGVDVPTPIPNMANVRYFSSGYMMGAIKNDSTGWAWGYPIQGGAPMQVITDAYFVDAGSNTISYVKNDGTVWSIGDNGFGQFGNGTAFDTTSIPKQMQTINNAVRVANNQSAIIILLSDSTLMAVGSDFGLGVLGLGPTVTQTLVPLPIPGLSSIIDIKSNAKGTIALTNSGNVYYWGRDITTGNPIPTPYLLSNLNDIIAISGCDDGYHFLALDQNKNCFGWGDFSSPMGLPFSTNTSIPQIVATDVIDIMAGESFSYIVKSNGSLWASGVSNLWGSIWLNLPDTGRSIFTQIDPSQIPGGCEVVTNISESVVSTFINIYPNPTSTHFIIEGLNQPYHLTVYNAVGQLLHQQQVIEYSKQVDVSSFSKGILFIRIEVADEVIYRKVIKQ
jgi:alpha-tubulin suppressor-like RCC1 family protein